MEKRFTSASKKPRARPKERQMKRVVIESPLAGDLHRNIRYARLCALDCIRRGEAPFASHLLMTQFLDDTVPEQRRLGIDTGLAWAAVGDVRAVYEDLGVSTGMLAGIESAMLIGQPIERRKLPGDLMAMLDGPLSGVLQHTEGIKKRFTPPRYDTVFAEGTRQLDAMAAGKEIIGWHCPSCGCSSRGSEPDFADCPVCPDQKMVPTYEYER